MKFISLLLLLLLCLNASAKNKKINTGKWHTEFQLSETAILPVTFDLVKVKKSYVLYVINAEERIALNNIKIVADSIFIPFPTFDSELKAKINSKNNITGIWYNYSKGADYKIPFISKNGSYARFPNSTSNISVSGKWEVTFDYNNDPEKAIGLFEHLTACVDCPEIKGTFLTETGDYRFLEGTISNDSLYLSTFDGSHAFLFRAQLTNDTLWGDFLSGSHYKTNWYAVKNLNFELGHPDSLTYLVNDNPIQLSLPDLNNQLYTYPNSTTRNKVTLIQIMGTWCPNCLDESRYLAEVKKKYRDQLEIISVSFEMEPSLESKIAKVKRYKEELDLDFTFLIGGKACKPCAANLFPMLNNVISFPTLLFIDKKGNTRKIHTGFSGPGTGLYYETFVKETNAFIEALIQE